MDLISYSILLGKTTSENGMIYEGFCAQSKLLSKKIINIS